MSKKSWWQKLLAWLGIDAGDNPAPDPTPQPSPQPTPTPTPQPGTLVPTKIAHGAEVAARGDEGRDGSTTIDGVKFRVFEIKSDRHFSEQAKRAKAIQVKDGRMVAHDFVNAAGQVMVWQYWTLGTSSLDGKSTENPSSTVKHDTRVWYTVHAPIGGTVTPQPDNPPPPAGGCQNDPPFCKDSDVPSIPDVSTGLGPAPRRIRGVIVVESPEKATNLRYRLMSYFHNQGWLTGYPMPDNPKSGAINVKWDTDLTENIPVSWEVNP